MDMDNAGDACDCLPNDPSIDSTPGAIADLSLSKLGSMTVLDWGSLGISEIYDAARGTTADLRTAGGTSDATCILSNGATPQITDSDPNPAPGETYYYIVRGQNACGLGSYGTTSSGVERTPTVDCP
jgi:hypothetical protein